MVRSSTGVEGAGSRGLYKVIEACSFYYPVEKILSLWNGCKLVEAAEGEKQNVRIALLEIGPGQEAGAEHFQAVPPRFVRSKQ